MTRIPKRGIPQTLQIDFSNEFSDPSRFASTRRPSTCLPWPSHEEFEVKETFKDLLGLIAAAFDRIKGCNKKLLTRFASEVQKFLVGLRKLHPCVRYQLPKVVFEVQACHSPVLDGFD